MRMRWRLRRSGCGIIWRISESFLSKSESVMLMGRSYVHRLLQNSSDGKLVELPSATTVVSSRLSSLALDSPSTRAQATPAPQANDTASLERSEHVAQLSAQVAEQRDSYETEICNLRSELSAACEKVVEGERLRGQLTEEQDRRRALEERVAELSTAVKRAESKTQIVRLSPLLPLVPRSPITGINPHCKTPA